MSKLSPAADRLPRSSGAAGHAYHAYGSRKNGSFGVGVATPAVILVVEDSEDLRCCVAEYLRIAGFEVVATENARQALAAIDAGIHIDLVFTDINMPGAMDGAALARWIAVNRPLLPIILTSGQSCPDLERAGPHRRFVRKPYSLDALEHDVREMIGTVVVQ
ncbi:MAG TPA: response regulator [Steroidobacteraceae bacterium]|jgi:CheY-like chemotaxis protein|nr:response regulator [Steroidobacteraceae bacterium]